MTTTLAPPPTPETEPACGLRPVRITVDLYERMIASGAFGDKSGIFLWKGQLVEKVADMTKGRPHLTAVNELDRLLDDLVRDEGYYVEQDQPIAIGRESMPEPDLKCVRGAIRDYASRTPTALDCPLVIEVADSSLEDDAGEMLVAYAAAPVPVYWIVNLRERTIDVYTMPSGPTRSPSYAESRRYGPDEQVPVVLDGRELGRIAVRDVLP
jgi:Uma2 family endonuclease